MLLTVKALQGRECSLQVSPEESVGALKALVAERLQVPVEQQRLLFHGKGCRRTKPQIPANSGKFQQIPVVWGIFRGYFWGSFGFNLELFWGDFWGWFWVILGFIWGYFCVIFGLFLGNFGLVLGLFLGYFGGRL
uniref:Uncharacterized protein n=1 Tax=Geospiza parvula TaxID=87175 RepID=A0A8U8BJW2_GEOPR